MTATAPMPIAAPPRPVEVPADRPRRDPVLRLAQAFALVTALICIVPIPLVLAVATTSVWQQGPFAGGITGQWLAEAWERISPNAIYSLRVAGLVLLLDAAVGLPAAWVLARRAFPGRRALLALTTVPIAVPGVAMALALVLAYPTLRADGTLLIAGHVLYTLPFLLGAVIPALGRPQLRELEQVAATLGAGPLRRLLTVTLPQTRVALLAAAIIVVTLSLGEFNVSFFLFSPLAQPLPVELYGSYLTDRLEIAAASTVAFLLLVVPAAVVLERLGGAKVAQA